MSKMGGRKDSDKVRDKVFLGTPCWTRHPLGPTSNRQNAIVSQFFLFLGYLLLKGSPCGTTRARHFSSELDPSKEAIRSVTHLGLACGMEQEASAKFEPKGTAEH